MKADFLFVDLNLSTIVGENANTRRKRQKHARFVADALKTRSIKMFKCWNSVVVFPSPNKFSGYAPSCTVSIYQNTLWFVFDLIYVVIVSSSTFYLSELTKFELIITIF